MNSKLALGFAFLLLCSLLGRSTAQSCVDEAFSGDRSYSSCSSLPYLNASLHWTYHPSNATLDVAYRALQSSSGWVAWAINPTSIGMAGANAFLAFPNPTTGATTVYATQISSTALLPSDVVDGNLTFTVYGREAEYSSASGYYTIYASLELPGNDTQQNTVWQASTTFSDGVPYGHRFSGDNVLSFATMDFSVQGGGLTNWTGSNLNSSSWFELAVRPFICHYTNIDFSGSWYTNKYHCISFRAF